MSEALDSPQLAATTPWARFGIELGVEQPDLVTATMPMGNLVNPLTDQPTAGPLAVLVDFTTGIVNYLRGNGGEWTVSSELSLELSPDAMRSLAAAPDVPVVAHATPLGAKGTTALSVCEIRHRDVFIGTGTQRSLYFTPTGDGPADLDLRSKGTRPTELADLMAIEPGPGDGGDGPTLRQRPEPALNNPYGIVHGGVAAAGLELAASAALNLAPDDAPLQTASLRVNYLREFMSGETSRYEGQCVRAGRRSGIAEARAIGADDVLALIAHVTAYRE